MSLPTIDAVTMATGNPPNFSHTTPAGTNRVLLVAVTDWNTAFGYTTGAYGGNGMTVVDSQVAFPPPSMFRVYRLINPPLGANNVVIGGAGAGASACAVSLSNVDQTTPLGTPVQATGASTTAQVAVAGTIDDLLLSWVSLFGGDTGRTSPQTIQGEISNGNSRILVASTAGLGMGSPVNMQASWGSVGSDSWAIGAVAVKSATPTAASKSAPQKRQSKRLFMLRY